MIQNCGTCAFWKPIGVDMCSRLNMRDGWCWVPVGCLEVVEEAAV